MSLPGAVWYGWVLAGALAVVSGVLLLQVRAEHVKGKLVAALGGTGAAQGGAYDWPDKMRRILLVGGSRIADWPLPEAPDGYHIIKRGRGGETSLQLAARLPQLLALLKPDVVVVSTGMNDLVAAALSPAQAPHIEAELLNNLDRITGQISQAGAEPVLSTIVQPARPKILRRILAWNSDIHSAVHRINTELLTRAKAGLRLLDTNATLNAGQGPLEPRFAQDTLHFNPAAYVRLSDALVQELTTQ